MDAHALRVLEYDALKQVLEDYAGSDLAKAVVRTLRPSPDEERLRLSLSQLAEACHLMDVGRPIPVRGLRDMVAVIRRAHEQSRPLEPGELLVVRDVLRIADDVRQFFQSEKQAAELGKLAARILDHKDRLQQIERLIENPGVVRDDASPKLLKIRVERRSLEDEIREIMNQLANGPRFKGVLQERAFSLRNGRHVLPVKLDKKGHVPGILHDLSASGGTAFIEPREVLVHANRLEDLRLDESREVARLLMEISRALFEDEARLKFTQDVLAWLDFTVAKATMSQDLGHRPATISKGPVMKLRRARHPLLDVASKRGQLPHPVVPLDLELGSRFRMLVVTGPNTGGKTVALKTVGLLQLMFQSGLHLPVADGTELPCLKAVHADIGDEQSLAQNLSTFSGHVSNIARILRESGEDSLVLLDELGAGTDPAEGAALGQALLEQLNQQRALCMVTTHLGVLKTYGFTHDAVENACVTFDVKTLRPTFRLLVGQPGNSNALVIAERYGIPASIIESARRLVGTDGKATEELVDSLVASRVAAEESRRESEDLVDRSKHKLRQADKALREARDERRKVEAEAEAEVRRVLSEFVNEARPHLNALRNVPKGLVPHMEALEALVRDRVHATPFASRRREFLDGLKKHDKVYVPRFGQVCRIEKLNRAEERLRVRVGAMVMEIAFADISWVTPPDAPGQ